MKLPVGCMMGLIGAVITGCDRDSGASSDKGLAAPTIHAWVSIAPQAFFVRRVGGPHVQVETLVQAGRSPATFEPTPKQLATLAGSDVYFRIGVPLEDTLMDKLGSVTRKVSLIDTRRGIELRSMKARHGHRHDNLHQHPPGAADPHIWLDPSLVKVQAETICQALSDLDPDHRDAYWRNLTVFKAELEAVRKEIAALLADVRGRRFYVFHPAYGYFADAFGLEQVAVEWSGKAPSAKQLNDLIAQARAEKVRTIFVQPQFGISSAQAVAEAVGGVVVPLDPLAADYLANLKDMAQKVRTALAHDPDPSLAAAQTPQPVDEPHE